MTSLEIAEVTGKAHKNVMRAIRNMEPAWERVNGHNFALVEYRDRKGELRPCYSLTKMECLYIATKFNDEARARLVMRWEQLETSERDRQMADYSRCDTAAYPTEEAAQGRGIAAQGRGMAVQGAPLIDLSGSRGSQASVIVMIGADGRGLALTPEMVARLLAAGGNLLPALPQPEWRVYHGPVRELVARTAHGIVREGVDDYTLYIRIPSKAYLQALGVSKETFFEAEFQKLMMQCAMEDE